jgi:hypothetical protein
VIPHEIIDRCGNQLHRTNKLFRAPHRYHVSTTNYSLESIGPKLKSFPFLALKLVLDVNSQSDASFSSCSVIGDMTNDNWSNPKLCHPTQRSASEIMASKPFCGLGLVPPHKIGDNVLADAKIPINLPNQR